LATSILAFFGLTGNFVSIYVMTQPKMRNSFNGLLTALCAFDSIFIVCNVVEAAKPLGADWGERDCAVVIVASRLVSRRGRVNHEFGRARSSHASESAREHDWGRRLLLRVLAADCGRPTCITPLVRPGEHERPRQVRSNFGLAGIVAAPRSFMLKYHFPFGHRGNH